MDLHENSMTKSLDLINEFEKNFEVEGWVINGLHIWPAVRVPLLMAWEKKLYYSNGEIEKRHNSAFYKIKKELKWWWVALTTYEFFKGESESFDVGVWGVSDSRVMAGGGYYSPFGDALRDLEFDGNTKVLCVDLTIHSKCQSHYSKADITLGFLFNRYMSYAKSLLPINQNISMNLEVAKAWCEARGLPSVGLTKRSVVNQFYLLKSLKKQYLDIIFKHKMKLCFKVCWYDVGGMALSWAAKEASIPCYDLQHGVAGAVYCSAYCAWSRMPEKGYEIIPDGFWCWTDEDAEAIKEWGDNQSPPIKTHVGGNIWQRLWMENKYPKNIFLNSRSTDNFLNVKGVKVLYTLQSGELPSLLLEMIKNSPSTWNWWIRCHPMELEHIASIKYKLNQFGKKVDVENATHILLPLLLKNTDVHITGWSAVVFDAQEFGLKSIVCHPSAIEFFSKMIGSKDVFYMDNADDIIHKILNEIECFHSSIEANNYPKIKLINL